MASVEMIFWRAKVDIGDILGSVGCVNLRKLLKIKGIQESQPTAWKIMFMNSNRNKF